MNRLEVSAAARADLFGIRFSHQDEARITPVESSRGSREPSNVSGRTPAWARAGRIWVGGAIRLWVEAPYLIVYREIVDGVEIARVIHGSRDLHAALRNDPG